MCSNPTCHFPSAMIEQEIQKRRTFAIISHPDAGKTTLTEKFLLYGGAVQLAGAVKARKNQRETTSDWMELERKRGISVSSTVLQFEYGTKLINLLDTPGHKDFSEDTYRVLTAVDSAVMVIDAAKGIETQTRKLFEVCRKRGVPIFTFMNKCDRPTKNPLELMDELERVLGIEAYAVNWPLGDGPTFKGVFDRRANQVHLFEKTIGGMFRAPVEVRGFEDPAVAEAMDPDTYARVAEELDMLAGAGADFNPARIRAGEVTPVFFGSAANNFGVQLMLDGFLETSPDPASRRSNGVEIPVTGPFSAFVFKIQGNMDPRHRDNVAFIRVCSGKFTRDMPVIQTRTGKKFRLSNSHRLFGQEREIIETAYAGDIVGLVGYNDLHMGDTLSEDPGISFSEIPRFPPECFSFIHNPTPSKYKPFRKGLDQLLGEGLVQSFQVKNGNAAPLLAAVGPLQFEVVQWRLQSEYGADARLEPTPWQFLRWIDPSISAAKLADMRLPPGAQLAEDSQERPVILFDADWALRYFKENHPDIELMTSAQ